MFELSVWAVLTLVNAHNAVALTVDSYIEESAPKRLWGIFFAAVTGGCLAYLIRAAGGL